MPAAIGTSSPPADEFAAGGALAAGGTDELPDAPLWLFDPTVECPAGAEALRGKLGPRPKRVRVLDPGPRPKGVRVLDPDADFVTQQVDGIGWESWIDGDPRVEILGADGRCGCDVFHWRGASQRVSGILHDGCEHRYGVHVLSGTLIGECGWEHGSRAQFAAFLRGVTEAEALTALGIRRVRLDVITPDTLRGYADDAAAAGDSVKAASWRDTADRMQEWMDRDTTAAGAAGEPTAGGSVMGVPATVAGVGPAQGVAAAGVNVGADVMDSDQLRLLRIAGHMPPPAAPLPVARRLVELLWTAESGCMTLRRWRGEWIAHTGTRWCTISREQLRQAVYVALEAATVAPDPEPAVLGAPAEPQGWNPTESRVDKVLDALTAAVLMPDSVEPDRSGRVAVSNGILDLATRTLTRHTPAHFSFTCLPYPYDCAPTEPVALLAFLRSLWPDDPDSIALIQEWLGYMVSGETRRQKALLLIGPPRSGKGTILWLIKRLVGAANAAAPTLAALCSNFGLQPLIGKSVALVGDARLSGSTSTTTLVERLLSIIGEDELQVDRKYRDPWTGRIGARITIASNELPRFADASAAVVSRLVVAEMTESFLGREDHGLKDRLAAELPAILGWALDGLDRLNRNGHFTRPAAAGDTEQALEDLASPTKAFLRECTAARPGLSAVKHDVFQRWQRWCDANGHHPGSAAWFARNLKSCGVASGKEPTGERRPLFIGIALLPPTAAAGQAVPQAGGFRGPQPVVFPIRPAG